MLHCVFFDTVNIMIVVSLEIYKKTFQSGSSKRASSEDSEGETRGEEAHCAALVAQINRSVICVAFFYSLAIKFYIWVCYNKWMFKGITILQMVYGNEMLY